MLNLSSDGENAAILLEQVIESINNKDKESLAALFSERSLQEAPDLDENIDALFSFIQGPIEGWEKKSGPTVFETTNYGNEVKEVNSYFYITTSEQEYFFLFQDYPVYTGHPDNVGLYLLLVVKEEERLEIYDGDNKILFDGDTELKPAGIYLPIK